LVYCPADVSERSHTRTYLEDVGRIAAAIDAAEVDKIVALLVDLRRSRGRLFFIGVGGGAGNATHAVNDFRKIAGIECYTPTDNVSELTARVNDEGWETSFERWLETSRLGPEDVVFVFSVGGGSTEKKISVNIVRALELARKAGARVAGIVGRDGGYTAKVGDACVIVPTVNSDTVTPHTESFQSVLWHLIVSHPDLRQSEMKWESVV
jgi:D-sedoheptulose 7-phosphate isomerase